MQKPDFLKKRNIDVLKDNITHYDCCLYNDDSDDDDDHDHDNHEYCTYITSLIADYVIYDKKDIPNKLVERYLRIVCKELLCWSLQYNDHVKYCNYIFEHNKNISYILHINNAELFDICLKYNENLTKDMYNILNPNILSQTKLLAVIDKLIKLECYNNELLEISINKRLIICINHLLDLKVKIDQKYFTDIISIAAISTCNSIDIIKKCIANGCSININTIKEFIRKFYIICGYYNDNSLHLANIFKFLYENNSTDINISDILLLCEGLKCKFASEPSNSISEIINYLVDKNYNLTQNEFEQICDEGIKINNISKVEKYFNIKSIQNKIYTNNINYPIKINYDIEILKHECSKSGNISKIRTLLKTVPPNEECLENACLKSNNIHVVKLLHEEHKIKMTDKCLLNVAQDLHYNQSIGYVLNLYNQRDIINNN
jgi:hypothetical protein